MKLIGLFIFAITLSLFGQQKEIDLAKAIDHDVYKTYKIIHYKDLPRQIKEIMKKEGCGTIGADPSPENDYKTNYDSGYIIDLNDDKKPEYLFSCTAPSHGPGQGKIFSLLDGKWTVIGGLNIYENSEPEVNIQVLKSRNQGFHDLASSDVYTYRDVIMRYIDKMYYNIHTSDEIIKALPEYIKHVSKGNLSKVYLGISNTPEKTVNEKLQSKSNNYEKLYYAVDSSEEAQKVKAALIKKGYNFLDEYNNGQIIFCYIKIK